MPAEPNMGTGLRAGYVLVGLGLAAWGFFGVETAWLRYAMAIGGSILVVEGIIGYCLTRAMLGLGKKS